MLHRIPLWFQQLFTGYTWQLPSNEKVIYLTFDDGPIPELTEWVLDVLDEYKIKASFFVVGENVKRNPRVFTKLISAGHTIGNHTYHHVKGWGTSTKRYVEDVEKCSNIMIDNGGKSSVYFRPPHGRIKPAQAKLLRKSYQLVMWNVLSVDYDRGLSKEKCLKNTIDATRSGAIVVFHDSIKAEKNLKYVLPAYIKHFIAMGYSFNALP